MNKQLAERNIRLYYVFRLFFEPLFWGPILIIFIQLASGMSLAEVYLMEAVCILVSVFLEIPTGALADLIGRRKTIIVGYSLVMVMMLMFSLAESRLMMWLADIVCFAGITFVSGADSALLFDSLKFLGREGEHKKILGRALSWRYFLIAICSVVGGYLATINMRLPLFLCLPPMILNWLVAWWFTEAPFAGNSYYDAREHWRIMKTSVLFVANHLKVKWLISFMVLVSVAGKLWFFTYNNYFVEVGLPMWTFGWIFAALNVVAGVFSYRAHWLYSRLGDDISVIGVVLCLGLPILAMGSFVIWPAALLVIVQNFVRGYFEPFINDFLQQYLDSENRATVLSIKSAVTSSVHVLSLLVFGWLLASWSLATCLQILGVSVLTFGAILIWSYRKIFVSKVGR